MTVSLEKSLTDVELKRLLPKVRTSKLTMEEFDPRKIAESLVREAGLDWRTAEEVAAEVMGLVIRAKLKFLSAPLIRELVNYALLERGLEEARKRYTRVGMPVYDVDRLLDTGINENANLMVNPESIHKWAADRLFIEHALLTMPEHIADAHMSGLIHIHDLEYWSVGRPFCLSHDPRFVLTHGLLIDGTGLHSAVAGPAKHWEVAICHMCEWLGAMQVHCAGGQGLEYFNIFLAPFLAGRPYREYKQAAQMFIYNMEQMYVARGGQSLTADQEIFVIREGRVEKVRIGEFVDELLSSSNGTRTINGMEYAKLDGSYKTLAFDPVDLRVKPFAITGVSRHRPNTRIYEVRTRTGRSIRLTDWHALYTVRGGQVCKVRASELKPGDRILVPTRLPEPEDPISQLNLIEELLAKCDDAVLDRIYVRVGGSEVPIRDYAASENRKDEEAEIGIVTRGRRGLKRSKVWVRAVLPVDGRLMRLLGYYTAEGYMARLGSQNRYIRIATRSQRVVRDVAEAVEGLMGIRNVRYDADEGAIRFGGDIVKVIFHYVFGFPFGKSADKKRVPAVVLSASNEHVAEFLRAYFTGDGTCSAWKLEATTTSPGLARDLVSLLLRLGINAHVSTRHRDGEEIVIKGRRVREARVQYRLRLPTLANKRLFLEKVGFLDCRDTQLREWVAGGPRSLPREVDKLSGLGELLYELGDLTFMEALPSYVRTAKHRGYISRRHLEEFVRLARERIAYLRHALDGLFRQLTTCRDGGRLRDLVTALAGVLGSYRRLAELAGTGLVYPSRHGKLKARAWILRSLERTILATRERLRRAEEVAGFLEALCYGDVGMDEVVSVEEVEYEGYVYDLEVRPDGREIENFVANNVFTSNTVFSSIAVQPDVPDFVAELPAVLPGGKVSESLTYGDFAEEARLFFRAIVEVYYEGDWRGKPFNFPKLEVKLTEEGLEKSEEDYLLVTRLAAKFGTPYFLNQIPDYMPKISHSQCCRLIFGAENDERDMEDFYEGRIRMTCLHYTTINLPRIAYEAKGDDERLFDILAERLELAKESLLVRRQIVAKALKNGRLPLLAMDVGNGDTYYPLDRAWHNIGFVGLNEMLKAHTGFELHEDREAWRFGLKVVKFMSDTCNEFAEETGLRWALLQTPAESCAHRLALIDLREFGDKAVVQGDRRSGAVYYTNSSHIRPSADLPLMKRLLIEGSFHPLTTGGAIAHVWLGERRPDPRALWELTKRIATKTNISYFAHTLDYTVCPRCWATEPGLRERCPRCGYEGVEWYSRVTGYYSRVSRWNAGKKAELLDRRRYDVA